MKKLIKYLKCFLCHNWTNWTNWTVIYSRQYGHDMWLLFQKKTCKDCNKVKIRKEKC